MIGWQQVAAQTPFHVNIFAQNLQDCVGNWHWSLDERNARNLLGVKRRLLLVFNVVRFL